MYSELVNSEGVRLPVDLLALLPEVHKLLLHLLGFLLWGRLDSYLPRSSSDNLALVVAPAISAEFVASLIENIVDRFEEPKESGICEKPFAVSLLVPVAEEPEKVLLHVVW